MKKKQRGAGQYRHFVEIKRNEPTTNAARQQVDEWQLFCERRCRITPVIATEQYTLDANSEVLVSHIIRLRNDPKTKQINEGFLVVFEGRSFEVQSAIDPDGYRKEIELRVTERSFSRGV